MYNYEAGVCRVSFRSRWVCFVHSLQNISPAGWFWSGTLGHCRHCLCKNHFVCFLPFNKDSFSFFLVKEKSSLQLFSSKWPVCGALCIPAVFFRTFPSSYLVYFCCCKWQPSIPRTSFHGAWRMGMNLLGGEAIEMEQFRVEGCIWFWLDVGKSIAERAVYLI